jgi:hypothetical protein
MQEAVSAYHPQPHQTRFHASDAVEKLFLAGVGAGKSLCGVHESVFLAEDNPRCDGAIVAPTFPMLKKVILPLWEEWVHPSLYTWKKADQYLIWHSTGRKIFLGTAADPGRLSGLNLGWAWLDEAAQLRRDEVWKILQARIRDPKAQRRCLFTTTTPLGLNWLVREFRKLGVKRHIVRARTADNVHLAEGFEAGLRAAYGPEYAAQFLDAMVLELAGVAFPYMPSIHSRLTRAEMMKRIVATFGAVDWGFTNPAALLVGGIDFDGRWYLIDEWYRRGQNREDIAAAAGELNRKWGVKQWYSDHDPEGVGKMQKEGCGVTLAEKDIEQGVQFARSLFPVRHDGQPRIHVAAELENWRREVDGYFFPEETEVPEGQFGDHLMDTTRYLTYTHSLTWVPVAYETVASGRMKREARDWSNTEY